MHDCLSLHGSGRTVHPNNAAVAVSPTVASSTKSQPSALRIVQTHTDLQTTKMLKDMLSKIKGSQPTLLMLLVHCAELLR